MNNNKCSVYLRKAFISLEVDVGGGVDLRAAFNRVNTVTTIIILYLHQTSSLSAAI